MNKKRTFMLLLLLFCLLFRCFGGTISDALNQEIMNLEELEQSYLKLQNDYEMQTQELNNLRMDLPTLQMDLEISTKSLQKIEANYIALLKDYESLQTKSNILKIGCITLGITTAVTVPLLIWSFNRKE